MNSPIRLALTSDVPGFSLEVRLELPGTGVSVLFGPSGAGKTTVLRCLAGLHRAHGTVSVAGDIWQDSRTFVPVHQRPLGYVFQEASLFPHLDVMANLLYGFARTPPAARRIQPEQAIAWLGIGDMLKRRPQGLSGGERQRVAIARALLTSPRLLLMDEPLSALDQRSRGEIMPYLQQLQTEMDIPVVYVTHAADEVARLADHLVLMENGRVLASGPLTETMARTDIARHREEQASVVVEARVTERDPHWHLARADFDGGSFWSRDPGIAVGERTRIRVLARDVSLASSHHDDTSILNSLQGVVEEIVDGDHPAVRLVKVRVGNTPLLARLTTRSAANLALAPGKPVWVQVKSVAVI